MPGLGPEWKRKEVHRPEWPRPPGLLRLLEQLPAAAQEPLERRGRRRAPPLPPPSRAAAALRAAGGCCLGGDAGRGATVPPGPLRILFPGSVVRIALKGGTVFVMLVALAGAMRV